MSDRLNEAMQRSAANLQQQWMELRLNLTTSPKHVLHACYHLASIVTCFFVVNLKQKFVYLI